MAQSSMHIGAGSAGSLWHNSREKQTENSIFLDEKNEVSHNAKEAFSIYRNELQIRSEAYTNRTGQKLQKKSYTHLSAIVNLNANHTMEDLEKLKQHLEDTLDTKVFQMAIHRDEGHVDENGKPQKNYHAHIEFMGLDGEGASVRKKLTKKTLSELQTKTAEILGMERGINYAKERKHRPRRLDTYEYKAAMKHKEEAVQVQKLTVKQVKAEMEILRREMASAKQFSKEDYQILSKLKKQLKKNTIPEIYAKFQELQKEVADAIAEKKALEQKLEQQNTKTEKLENVNAKLHSKLEELHQELAKPSPELGSELEELQAKISELKQIAKDLNIKLEEPKPKEESADEQNQTLEEKIKSLKSQVKALTKAIDIGLYAQKQLDKMNQKEQDEKFKELENKYTNATEKIEELVEKIDELESENGVLKNQPPKIKIVENPINAELQEQNNTLKGTVDALQEQNAAKDEQILALEQKVPNLEHIRAYTEEKLDIEFKRTPKLKELVDYFIGKIQSFTQKITSLTTKNRALKEENKEKTENLKQADETFDKLENILSTESEKSYGKGYLELEEIVERVRNLKQTNDIEDKYTPPTSIHRMR